MKRGIRLLNGRKQVLLQDEINTSADAQWRMHTNATVSFDSDTQATLTLGGQTLKMQILNAPSGVKFAKTDATRYPSDPQPPQADQDNPGVTVVTIDVPAGQATLQVLFNPQWSGFSSFVTPPNVALDQWTLTSHN
jgi:hypothetical protein